MQSSQATENQGWASSANLTASSGSPPISSGWPTASSEQQRNQDVSNANLGLMTENDWRDRRLGTGVPYEDAEGVDLGKLPTGSRLYVANLPRCTKNDIFELFARHGKVVEIVLNNSYGYVQYEKVEDCKRAHAAEQGGMFMGYRLDLEVCRDQPSYIVGSKAQDDSRSKKRYDQSDSSRRDSTVSRSRDDRDSYRDHHRDYPSSNGANKNRLDEHHRDSDRDRRDRDRDKEKERERDYDKDKDRERDRDRRRDVDDDRHRRRRSLSPSQRDNSRRRGSSRSPSRQHKGPQAESSIFLPFRFGNMVPYCQILAIDQLERKFVGPIEKLFRQADIQLHIYQMPHNSVGPSDIKRLVMEGVQAVIFLKKHHQESGMVTLQVFDPEAKVGDEKIGYDEYQLLEPRDAVEIVRRHKDLRKKVLETRESKEVKDTREETPRPRRSRSPEPPRMSSQKSSDSHRNNGPLMPPPPPVPPVLPTLPVAPPQFPTPTVVPPMVPSALPMPPAAPSMSSTASAQAQAAAGLNPTLLSMLTGGVQPNVNNGANILQLLSLIQNMQSVQPQLLQQLAQSGMLNAIPQANATPASSMSGGFSQAQLTTQGILTTTPASFAPALSPSMPHSLPPGANLTASAGYITPAQAQSQHAQPQLPQQPPQPTQQQLQVPPLPPTPPQQPAQTVPRVAENKESEPPIVPSPPQSNQSSRVADILKQLAQLQKQGPAQR